MAEINLTHPLPSGTRTSGFGPRGGGFHSGVDFGAPTGTPVVAAAPGTVTFAGNRVGSGYGIVVYLDHGSGTSTRYAHLSGTNASVGQSVNSGQEIGRVGSTGDSTGPHLHFELLLAGDKVDPEPYLAGKGVATGTGDKWYVPDAVENVTATLSALSDIIEFLTEPKNWYRIGLFVFGLIMLGLGVLLMIGSSIVNALPMGRALKAVTR